MLNTHRQGVSAAIWWRANILTRLLFALKIADIERTTFVVFRFLFLTTSLSDVSFFAESSMYIKDLICHPKTENTNGKTEKQAQNCINASFENRTCSKRRVSRNVVRISSSFCCSLLQLMHCFCGVYRFLVNFNECYIFTELIGSSPWGTCKQVRLVRRT